MKGNIKKLALVVIMTAIPMLIAVATASAKGKTYITGEYALSGYDSCSFVVGGTPTPANSGIQEATYTFNRDGTGSATGWVRTIPGSTNYNYFTEEFTYTVTDGNIEFKYPTTTGGIIAYLPDQTTEILQLDGGPGSGVISPDGKTMTIACGPPIVLHVIASPLGPPVGTEVDCVISLSGMRMN